MNCKICRADFSPNAKFCHQCGATEANAWPKKSKTPDVNKTYVVLVVGFVLLLVAFLVPHVSRNDATTGDSVPQLFGDASCSAYSGDKGCNLVNGNVRGPVQALHWSIIPDGERLTVLGRSEELEGMDHGASWYKVRTEHGPEGYIQFGNIKCDGETKSCLMSGDLASFPKAVIDKPDSDTDTQSRSHAESPAAQADSSAGSADFGGIGAWDGKGVEVLRKTFPGASIEPAGGEWVEIIRANQPILFVARPFLSSSAISLLIIGCSDSTPAGVAVVDSMDSTGSRVQVHLNYVGLEGGSDASEEDTWIMGAGILAAVNNPKRLIYRVTRSSTVGIASEGAWSVVYQTRDIDRAKISTACHLSP